MKTIPDSPEDMPMEFHNSENQIRNCLVTLDQFQHVGICWEMDVAATNREGEPVGEWEVVITTRRRNFKATHSYITNALWYAVTLAEAHDSEAWEQREKARCDALRKLTLDQKADMSEFEAMHSQSIDELKQI
jgi:hypothetical protein